MKVVTYAICRYRSVKPLVHRLHAPHDSYECNTTQTCELTKNKTFFYVDFFFVTVTDS